MERFPNSLNQNEWAHKFNAENIFLNNWEGLQLIHFGQILTL